MTLVTSPRDEQGVPAAGRAGRRYRTRSLSRGPVGAVVLPVIGVVLFLVAWWLLTTVSGVNINLIPPPGHVLNAFLQLPGYLMSQSVTTLVEVLEGFVLAVVTGALIALALVSSPVLERMTYPLLLAVNSVPKVAVAPLLVLWMGFGQLPKVIMVLLVCFFPVVLSTVAGLTSTPAEFIELARSLEAARWRAFVKIRIPSALPQVFVGLKLAMSLAVIGAVISEFQAGTVAGLGFVISTSSGQMDTAQAFAAIAILGVMSIVLFYALVALERVLIPWARPAARS
ncbi:MAG TPA: ABC transporter permease [Rugosimonospora sp.]|nr:ABC transporter permease [Rugosimonospora sp.]